MRINTWTAIAAGALLAGHGVLRAQDASAPKSGIFLTSTDAAGSAHLVQLQAVMVTNIRQTGLMKVMLTQGHAKGSTEGTIPGAAAAVRAAAGAISFEFRFDGNAGKGGPTDLNEAMKFMSGEALPGDATNADSFVLVRLHASKGSRSADLGSMTGERNASLSKDAIATTSQAVGPGTFRVQAKEPLGPGEYAFYWNRNGKGFGGQLWDFGVDAK